MAFAIFMPDYAKVDRVYLSLADAAENTETRAFRFNSSVAAISTVITERVIRSAIPLSFSVNRSGMLNFMFNFFPEYW